MLNGTINTNEWYQEMMGKYIVYEKYPQLDFTGDKNAQRLSAGKVFPVYAHQMFKSHPLNNNKQHAFLYFYYNSDRQKFEKECPEGCWIIGKHYLHVTHSSTGQFSVQ